jgi:DNA processing protein
MDAIWLNALNIVFGLSRIRKLLSVFGSAQKAWQAPSSKLSELNFESDHLKEILIKREITDPQLEWQKLNQANVQTITLGTKDYPKILKEISSPPWMIYYKGDKSLLNQTCLAVVGTRTPSNYGQLVIELLIKDLVSAHLVIVSGLAQGVDALVHQATLKANGKTVAVLGCGLDQVYPKMNESIANQMLRDNNLIISEYPLNTPALKQNFPARNRIIAGLSLGTLVIESKENGGALITAQQALENNREVFAIPGPINQFVSLGTNKLIQAGAKAVICAQDILQELNLTVLMPEKKNTIDWTTLTDQEKLILTSLTPEALHIDKIVQISKLETRVVGSMLVNLELKGLIKNMGGQIYTLN